MAKGKGGKDPTRGKFPPRGKKASNEAKAAKNLIKKALAGRNEAKVARALARANDIPVKDALALIRSRTGGSQRGNGHAKYDNGDHFRDG